VFELSVTDDDGASATDQILVTVNPVANTPPMVDAGDDQSTSASQLVTLISTSSDNDGDVVAWQWLQLSGTSVTLVDTDQASLTFTSPVVAVSEQLVFEVTVTDDDGASSSDQISVTIDTEENSRYKVNNHNTPPIKDRILVLCKPV
jgi:xanthine/CO dehydrogenase XdhC/CoxF family maturation factor